MSAKVLRVVIQYDGLETLNSWAVSDLSFEPIQESTLSKIKTKLSLLAAASKKGRDQIELDACVVAGVEP